MSPFLFGCQFMLVNLLIYSYYLLTAEGGTRYNHAATIARSRSLYGPYEVHPDNPLITSWPYPRNPLQKAGHASIVHTHTDEWFLVHLTGRPLPREGQPLLEHRGYCPLGRETAIQRLEWRDGWPYVVGGINLRWKSMVRTLRKFRGKKITMKKMILMVIH